MENGKWKMENGKWKNIAISISLIIVIFIFTGCTATGEVGVEVEKTLSDGTKARASGSIKISNKSLQKESLDALFISSIYATDVASFKIRVDETNSVTAPESGQINLSLLSSQKIISSQSFTVIKNGSYIEFEYPDDIAYWIDQYSNVADEIYFSLNLETQVVTTSSVTASVVQNHTIKAAVSYNVTCGGGDQIITICDDVF